MKLLPWDNLILDTSMSPSDAARAIGSEIQPWSPLAAWMDHKAFWGRVSDSGFKATPIFLGRSPFRAVAVGRFEPGPWGTTVVITMRPTVYTLVSMAIWFALSLWIGVLTLAPVITQAGSLPVSGLAVPVGMAALGYVMFWGLFWLDAAPAENTLRQLLPVHVSATVTAG